MVGVERAQRVLLEPRAHLLRQLVLARAQECPELVDVVARVSGVPRLDEPQPRRPRAGPLEDLGQQEDQLSVERGVVGAERLGVDLGELAEAARLRGLMPEERPAVQTFTGCGSLCMPCSA